MFLFSEIRLVVTAECLEIKRSLVELFVGWLYLHQGTARYNDIFL